jgi:hypothetical protein
MSMKTDLERAIKLANEWVAWFAANGEAFEPEPPNEADWARAIVAMSAVCDAARLELSTIPSRHRRERLGDPRLHRIFDALEAMDTGSAPKTADADDALGIEVEIVNVGPQDIGELPTKPRKARAKRGAKAARRTT